MRRLIVNADDLGYDPEIDRGILEAHAGGLVTSATAMVDTPFAAAALRAAPPTLGLGLHLVLDADAGEGAAAAEIARQLGRFEALRGAPPTHLDGHKHHHLRPGAWPAVLAAAAARGLPVRVLTGAQRAEARRHGVPVADHFLGDAERRPAWDEAALVAALGALGAGWTELMAHPGHRPAVARTSFGAEREVELRALTGAAAREALRRSGAQLATWAGLHR